MISFLDANNNDILDFVWTKQLVAHSRNLSNLNKNNKHAGAMSVVVIVVDVVDIALGVVSIVVDVVGAKEVQRPSASLYLR